MREIKFRAWDGEAMRYPGHFGLHGYLSSADILGRYETVMQYTGLKDKNGKEIYEGDVLDGHDDGLVSVVWRHGETQFDFADGGNIGVWEMNASRSEVIGNIYENPELLEAK